MSAEIAPQFAGPWPDGIPATRVELARYLDEVADGSIDALLTRCEPWTVRDVTIHVTETFRRFRRMLEAGRAGDFTPPFSPDELDAENLRAVAAFTGDAVSELTTAVSLFLDDLADPDEPMPHQLGTLPAGLQVHFGLMDIAMHHEDVCAAAGLVYRPSAETIAALLPMTERLFGMPPDQEDPWALMVFGSGRLPVG
jgi:uncharacterized protein (TIGR03083 family)